MSASIRRFVSPAERLRRDEHERLRALLLDAEPGFRPEVGRAIGRIVAAVDAEAASSSGWTFIMLSPAQNGAVIDYLFAHALRPRVSVRFWALCFQHLRTDTGEITLSRRGFAEILGVTPRCISSVVTELVDVGAISRLREGREVRLYMNPNVATHLGGKLRDDAQRAAPALSVVDGGR